MLSRWQREELEHMLVCGMGQSGSSWTVAICGVLTVHFSLAPCWLVVVITTLWGIYVCPYNVYARTGVGP